MFDTMATVFGMSVDDVVKIMVGLGAFITAVLGALGKFLRNIHGAKKRTFIKIRRLENIVDQMVHEHTQAPSMKLQALMSEMTLDQRDASDAKDSDE